MVFSRKQLWRTLLLLAALIVVVLLWPKPCEQYGGMMIGGSQSWNCRCIGVKITTQDNAAEDGLTIKPCIGIALHHVCSQWYGVQRHREVLMVPCNQK